MAILVGLLLTNCLVVRVEVRWKAHEVNRPRFPYISVLPAGEEVRGSAHQYEPPWYGNLQPKWVLFSDSIEWVWWVSISGTKRPPVRGRAPFADPLDDFPDRTSFHFDEGLPQ